MKYLLIFAVIMLLGCDMPGVGELSERVDELEETTAYDDSDIVEQVYMLEGDIEIIDERVSALEHGDLSDITQVTTEPRTPRDIPVDEPEEEITLVIADIEGLQDSMDLLSTNLLDSILVLDESIELLVLSLDSLEMENDSLRADLEDLQSTVSSLSYTVENMRYTGSEAGATRDGSGTSSGGRGSSSTGGSTGGGSSSGGR